MEMPQREESQNKENGGDGDEEMGEPEEGDPDFSA